MKTTVVAILLEHNAAVDSQTDQGTTALKIAAANGHTEAVRLLLGKGADSSAKNKSGKSAADVAANEEIKLLLTNSKK